MERQLVKDDGKALFDLLLMLNMIHAEQPDLARIDRDDIQQTADRRGLARAVLSDKAHDAAARHIKADIVERKAVIFLRDVFDLDRIHIVIHIIRLRKRFRGSPEAPRA